MLSPTGEHVVELRIDPALDADEHVVDGLHLSAGSEIALQRAITALVRGTRTPGRHTPRHEWRGLHVDLARQFLPAADVGWLIDVAAWHGLNRLHLHLTDDEGWRVPVDGYPALTEVGAWRGDGLPIPPLLGSGSEPYGGAYTREEIAGWVEAADEAGVVLVPEVDLPGHCFAALAACPDLADPDDTSGAVSVQWFVDNVLNPGVPGWRPFVEAVFGSLADLFPSPWLHAGGDELPLGAGRRRAAADGPASSVSIVELIVVDHRAAGRGVAGGRRSRCAASRRRLRRRLEVGRRLPAARGGRVPGRRLARRGVLPRHGRRRRVALAGDELGRDTRRWRTSKRST